MCSDTHADADKHAFIRVCTHRAVGQAAQRAPEASEAVAHFARLAHLVRVSIRIGVRLRVRVRVLRPTIFSSVQFRVRTICEARARGAALR